VEVADEDAVEGLVAGLVAARIGVREVAPAANPLEELYHHLQAGAPSCPVTERAQAGDAR
jgi:ABC-2 type transport system ATP-binding protein